MSQNRAKLGGGTQPLSSLLSALSLIILLAFAWGCDVEPLDEPISQELLSANSMQAHFSPDRIDSLGEDLLKSLVESSLDHIRISPSQIKQETEDGSFVILDSGELVMNLSEVHASMCPTGVNLHLVFAPSTANVDMEVSMGQQTVFCSGELLEPGRETFIHMLLQTSPPGSAELIVDGDPGLSGEPLSLAFDDPCQIGEPAVDGAGSLLDDSVNAELAGQLEPILEKLSALSASALGIKMGVSGKVGENLRFSILPEAVSTSSNESGDCNLSYSGGFDSQRAWCVPSNVSTVVPANTDSATFSDLVPGTDAPYSFAISLSLAFLRHGLLNAYKAGMFCSEVFESRLDSLDPVELFASLAEVGKVSRLRVSTRPLGTPDIIWAKPNDDLSGPLPGLYLLLPDVSMDVFVSVDGLDMRILDLKCDVSVGMKPRQEEGALNLDVDKVYVQQLQIGYNELTSERAGQLRQSTTIVIEKAIRDILEPMRRFTLDLPMYGGQKVLSYELDEQHLVVYLGDTE